MRFLYQLLFLFILSSSLAQTLPCDNALGSNPGSGYGILNVKLGSLNHSTPIEEGFSKEYDSTGVALLQLSKCQSYTMAVKFEDNAQYVNYLWIDWDDDGTFNNNTERILPTISNDTAFYIINVDLAVTSGVKTMRVASIFKGIVNACNMTTSAGDVEDYHIEVVEDDMRIDSIIVTQVNNQCIMPGDTCVPILRLAMHTSGTGDPVEILEFTVGTNGSTDAATDLSKAKMIYTGDQGAGYICNTPYGNVEENPGAQFLIAGSQFLNATTCNNIHYFWLAYDIDSDAKLGNEIDGEIFNILVTEQGATQTKFGRTNPPGGDQIGITPEICDNGIDDDCDGLVDCYDPDCADIGNCISSEDGFYYGSADSCAFVFDDINGDPGLEIIWSSDIGNFSEIGNAPLISDLDNDDNPEIIVGSSFLPDPEISIYDGKTGILLRSVLLKVSSSGYGAGIVADVNNDGSPEIVWPNSERGLSCYNYESDVFLWTSTDVVFPRLSEYLDIADFNGDGVPEIFDQNYIWDATTGNLLGTNPDGITGVHSTSAADLLPDEFCNSCEGLEILKGKNIYAIDITGGVATFSLESQGPFSNSNFSIFSISADVNSDNKLDIVTFQNDNLFLWDSQTEQMIDEIDLTTISQLGAIGRSNATPVVNDIDNDGKMEYLLGNFVSDDTIDNALIVLDDDLTYLWHQQDLMLEVFITPVVFDLEGDGNKEIIIRTSYQSNNDKGNPYLYILNAITGNKLDSTYMEHGTRTTSDNSVSIADVDRDGEVEIVVTGSTIPGGDVELHVLHSNTNQWVCGRDIWNKILYHPTEINDDLTIPRNLQNRALLPIELGGNSIQAAYKGITGGYTCPLPDAIVNIDSSTYIGCDSIRLFLTACNIGRDDIGNFTRNYALYNGDPLTGGSLMSTDTLSHDLDTVESCIEWKLTLPLTQDTLDLYVVINDDGSNPSEAPVTLFNECRTDNNFSYMLITSLTSGTFSINQSADSIIAGEDILISASGAVQYLWLHDNTTDSSIIANPQLTTHYCVELTDSGGCTDTLCAEVYVTDVACDEFNFFIPNSFSPNNDLVNDQLCILNTNCIQEFIFNIYNRYGTLVFSTSDKTECWNGVYKHRLAPAQSYVYFISGKFNNGTEIIKNGSIMVVY